MEEAIDDVTPLFPMKMLSGAVDDQEVSSCYMEEFLETLREQFELLLKVTLQTGSVHPPLMEYLKMKARPRYCRLSIKLSL